MGVSLNSCYHYGDGIGDNNNVVVVAEDVMVVMLLVMVVAVTGDKLLGWCVWVVHSPGWSF